VAIVVVLLALLVWLMTTNKWRLLILDMEGLSEWRVENSNAGSHCWHDTKLIQMLPDDKSPSGFLHEVAHVFSPEPEGTHKNHFHGGLWFSQFQRLVDKYMVTKQFVESNDTDPL
jgi:hypothetical protein